MIVATGNHYSGGFEGSIARSSYHTYCLELPGVPEAPEWTCPLCEVDQLSADEELYEDSDPEELEDILFDETLNPTGTDTEVRRMSLGRSGSASISSYHFSLWKPFDSRE